jgi:subtilisin family serine protease
MRRTTLLLTLMGAILLACSGVVLAQPPTPTQNVEDSYIVVLEDGVQRPAAVASEHARAYGLQVRFVYTSALEGYAAVLPNAQALRRVQSDERVAYVEPDGVASAIAQTVPWGVNKVSTSPDGTQTSSTQVGNGSGAVSNVNAYIIDTGIYYHADLNVVGHVNPSRAGGGNKDCNGHGTHVAGTVAAYDNTSYVVGVAPGVKLTGVKVLDCAGYGSWSGVIAGIDWVTQNAAKPAIANMSLGGGARVSVDQAVKNSADSGVFYSIAAGNDGDDACKYSPARAGARNPLDGTMQPDNGIMTVAATNSSDGDPSWSNYGACVDIWAPGVSILSTKKGGGTTTMSGTSMAAPHGAGGGALYLSSKTAEVPTTAVDSTTVEVALKSSATTTTNLSNDQVRTITREYVGGF